MSNQNRIFRLYRTDDASMLEYGDNVLTRYTADMADFTAFSTIFDQTYADTLEQQIADAEGFGSDNQQVDIVVQTTQNMLEKMDECRNHYGDLKFFIEEAFPTQVGVQGEFGFNDYDGARNSQSKLIQFMNDLALTVQKYESQLLAAGCSQDRIDETQTLAVELKMANRAQEAAKGERADATYARILLLNTVWMTVQKIRRAAKRIYKDNYAKLQLYLLPWNGGVPTEEDMIEGSVAEGQTIVVAVPGLEPSSVVTLNNLGTVPLMFCAGEVGAMPCVDGLVLAPGDSQSVTMLSLAPEGVTPTFLNVSHTIAPLGSPDGEFGVVLVS